MDAWTALSDLLLLLSGGFVLGALAERLRQSAILGYLVAGMLLGPHALHWVETKEQVSVLAELGVALLLFSIGLEFSWQRLKRTGAAGLRGGALQVIATLVLGAGAASLFGLGWRPSLALGAILALSSTAYVLRLLSKRAETDSLHGRTAVGVLLLQDVAVVPLVILIGALIGGGSAGEILTDLGRLFGFALLLVLVIWALFTHVVPRLLGTEVLRHNRELPLLLAVASGLGSAYGAHELGFSPAIGAFLAGMMLAETPFAMQVRSDVSALRTLLLVLFFGSIGMLGDPSWISDNVLAVLACVAAVVIGKGLVTALCLRGSGTAVPVALAAGIALAQIGEFSFVLAELARDSLLSEELFQLVVSVTIVTLALTPYLIAAAPRVGRRVARVTSNGRVAASEAGEAPSGHVLVVGYGPTGQAVADSLVEIVGEVHVIDLNARLLAEARRNGHHPHLGDASHPEVLEHAAVDRALAIAITIPDPQSVRRIIEQARSLAPGARIFTRARYKTHVPRLVQLGAHAVVDEEQATGRELAGLLADELRSIGCDAQTESSEDS
jgi:CPA2 family monovalent cation:H+ antiporter-2